MGTHVNQITRWSDLTTYTASDGNCPFVVPSGVVSAQCPTKLDIETSLKKGYTITFGKSATNQVVADNQLVIYSNWTIEVLPPSNYSIVARIRNATGAIMQYNASISAGTTIWIGYYLNDTLLNSETYTTSCSDFSGTSGHPTSVKKTFTHPNDDNETFVINIQQSYTRAVKIWVNGSFIGTYTGNVNLGTLSIDDTIAVESIWLNSCTGDEHISDTTFTITDSDTTTINTVTIGWSIVTCDTPDSVTADRTSATIGDTITFTIMENCEESTYSHTVTANDVKTGPYTYRGVSVDMVYEGETVLRLSNSSLTITDESCAQLNASLIHKHYLNGEEIIDSTDVTNTANWDCVLNTGACTVSKGNVCGENYGIPDNVYCTYGGYTSDECEVTVEEANPDYIIGISIDPPNLQYVGDMGYCSFYILYNSGKRTLVTDPLTGYWQYSGSISGSYNRITATSAGNGTVSVGYKGFTDIVSYSIREVQTQWYYKFKFATSSGQEAQYATVYISNGDTVGTDYFGEGTYVISSSSNPGPLTFSVSNVNISGQIYSGSGTIYPTTDNGSSFNTITIS